ncbi:MAG: hypothetical protein JNJ78_06510 [Anaerolineae bacterium]|nr:hypothetical protein [Anaerolineae bacterium]
MVVKKGGKKAMLPPRGVFVVVVVVVADKEYGTPSGTSCRPAAALRCTPKRQGRQNTGEDGADTLETSPLKGCCCQLVRGKWPGWRHWRQWHWQ